MASSDLFTDCTGLVAELRKAIAGSGGTSITLDAKLFPEAGVLVDFLRIPSLTITQVGATPLLQEGPAPLCATLTGTATLFPDGATPLLYRVTVAADLVGSRVRLLLHGVPDDAAGWSFSANFQALPKYKGFEPVEQVLAKLPSFYNTMVVANPVFSVATEVAGVYPAGVSFTGLVDMTKGDLEAAGRYFPDATAMPLAGTLVMHAGTYPTINFRGDLKGYTIPPVVTDLFLCFGATNPKALALFEENGCPDPASLAEDEGASTLLLVGFSQLPSFSGGPVLPRFRLSTPILQGDFTWVITGEIEDKEKYPLNAILGSLTSFAGDTTLPLPAGLNPLGFFLDTVTVGIEPSLTPSSSTIQMIGFRLGGPLNSWTAPIFGLTISDLYIEWQVLNPFNSPYLTGAVGGVLRMGPEENAPRLNVEVSLDDIKLSSAPAVSISAELDDEYPAPLSKLFYQFTGLEMDLNVDVTALLFEADTGPRTVQFAIVLAGDWPFNVDPIKFGEVNFLFNYAPNRVTGTVSAHITVASLAFLVSASYLGANEGWTFSGKLAPKEQGDNTLQGFVNSLTNNRYDPLPANLGDITLEQFNVSFNTKSQDFAFSGLLAWEFTELGLNTRIAAEISLKSKGVPSNAPVGTTRKYSGFVRGELTINSFRFAAMYSFDIANNTSISFVFAYKKAVLTLAYVTDGKTRLLTANLGGVSFGDIVDYLVNLVDPSLNFTLPAPWNVLYSLSFDNLMLTANLTKNTVGVSYKINANLGIINLESVGLTYVSSAGKSTVKIEMTGRYFDQKYTPTNPLSWDMLNDPPPAAPGKGEQLLDLRYVGIGQNVGFRSAKQFTNVQSVLKTMTSDFLPATTDDANPLNSPLLSSLQFAGDGRWLIGADFTLMGAVSLSVVFNDPTLYGLRIALAGEKVKSFSGLDFQILYKKVTDTVGVYHIELTLPSAFRQLNFGAVAITIPIVIVDVFTNGNFRIDFGFPKGLDFSASFCLQAGAFIGYGGFYFALLDGSTSERVPRISNGTFSPVIEAGLALSVGMGRTIDKGVFKAGATITLQGTLQGVFGWFNPNDSSVPSATYYWIQGTVALVGKLSGAVDFVVISAEVSLQLSASITMTFEAYKAVNVTVEFEVRASASLKILFIRVSFTFTMTLTISFSIGSGSTSPWIIQAPTPERLLLQQSSWRQPRMTAAVLHRSLVAAMGDDAGSFDWKPRAVFNTVQSVPLLLIPALTVALPELTAATAANTAANADPQVQIDLALFVPNTVPVTARTSQQIRSVSVDNAEFNPFNLICAGMLRWALSSYTRNPLLGTSADVYATDLGAISLFLGDAGNWQEVFEYSVLAELMLLNYQLQISSPVGPTGTVHPQLGALAAAAADVPEESYTIFPMVPELSVVFGSDPKRDYGSYNIVTPEWEAALAKYNAQLKTAASSSRANGPVGSVIAEAAPGDESLSTFLFRDYFAMVTRSAVDSASQLMSAYPYQATGASGPVETLAGIAAEFNAPSVQFRSRRGDTIDRIAARFGLHSSELHAANPLLRTFDAAAPLPEGTALVVLASVTPESIATANAEYPLNAYSFQTISMPVDGVRHQVRAAASTKSESLSAIAFTYGLPNATSLFVNDGAPTVNAIDPAVLQAGATLTVPAHEATLYDAAQNNAELVSAFFFVRNLGPAQAGDLPWYSDVNWYQQWILANNTLPSTQWTVPVVGLVDDVLTEKGTLSYVAQGAEGSALAPDTPPLVAGYFAMMQLKPEPYKEGYLSFVAQVRSLGAGRYQIPAIAHTIRAGETLESIALTFGVSIDALVTANRNVEGLLQLLAILVMPQIQYPIQEGDTFQSVATNLNLTVDELARSVKDAPGILAAYKDTDAAMTIPDVPARNTDALLRDLVRFGSFNNVSGMVANFLMHGMRVPAPDAPVVDGTFPPSTPLWGLYEIAGQQFPAPLGPFGPTGVEIVFAQTSPTAWIRLDAAGPSGSTGLSELPLTLTGGYFDGSPAPVLDPQILAGPGPLPLYRDTPPQYPLPQSIGWQSPTVITFPGPTSPLGPSGSVQPQPGQPTLWIFPPALQQAGETTTLGPTAATPPYTLLQKPSDGSTSATEVPVANYEWAMAVDVRVQQAASSTAAGTMPNTYVVLGADQDGRDDLLKAWTYLENSSGLGGSLSLLYSPGSASQNSSGLASSIPDKQRTFLLKSNLTTVTRSNLRTAALAAAAPLEYSATLADTSAFLKLLWEASITGSGGFYLNFFDTGGNGLPAELFADSDTATLTLLFVEAIQSRRSFPQRGLFPFNNCALLGDNIDAATAAIVAQLEKPAPGDLQRISTAPAGNAGFYLARRDPEATNRGQLTPSEQTRALFNLTGFQLAETNGFFASNQGLPVGSSETPVEGVSGPTGDGVWWYQQLVPVAQFGKQNQTPTSIALPPATANPYAGIAGPTGITGPADLHFIQIDLNFNDIYGNRTSIGATVTPVTMPIGYTDDLIGPSSWPGTGMDYLFRAGPSGSVELDAQLSFQTTRYLPNSETPFVQTHGFAVADAERYAQIFYQAQQHDCNFQLQTNLGKAALDPQSLKATLTAFISKASVFTSAAALLEQHVYETEAGKTLDGIAKEFGVTTPMLVEANLDVRVQTLFAGQVVQPAIVAAAPMNSLSALVVDQIATTFPPTCPSALTSELSGQGGWIGGLRVASPAMLNEAPAARRQLVDALTVEVLARNNETAPLTPGNLLLINKNTSTEAHAAEATMQSIADSLNCAVLATFEDAATSTVIDVGLYLSNFEKTGIVTAELKITLGGVTVDTGTSPTLKSVEGEFLASLQWSTGDFVAQLKEVPGLFLTNAALDYATFYVPQPAKTSTTTAPPAFSLADVPSSAGTLEELAKLNAAVANFYYTGAPIYLSYDCYPPQQFDTFRTLCSDFAITPAQFALFNGAAVCKQGAELAIPNLLLLPEDSVAYASLTPRPQDGLLDLATAISPADRIAGLRTLTTINANVPGIFGDDVSITLGVKGVDKTIEPAPMSSLHDIALLFGLTDEEFVVDIAIMPGLLRSSGAVLTPLPMIPADARISPSWNDLAGEFRLQPVEDRSPAVNLVEANRCLESFLLAGASIVGSDGSSALVVGPHDTIDTLQRRFQTEQHLEVSVAQLVELNGNQRGLLTLGKRFLLPPNATPLRTTVAAQVPPPALPDQDPAEAQVVFPVTVTLLETRNTNLVAPDFRKSPSISSALSTMTPRGWTSGVSSANSLDLTDFALNFEAAFAAHKLKAAVAEVSAGIGPTARALWAMNFGSNGVSECVVRAADPTFYALAPLSTHLLSGEFGVQPYKSGCGLCPTVIKKFDSVDLDAWMQQFLATIDLFLTTPYSVPAYQQIPSLAQSAPEPVADGPSSYANIAAIGSGSSVGVLPAIFADPDCGGCTGTGPLNGPANFESIVSSKLGIAQQLRQDVLPVLNGVGVTGPYYAGVAQEALYQQMLVELSNAYNVNAVVQYPVAVTSPCITPTGASGPVAPRLSGNITPALETVPPAAGDASTIQAAAALSHVSTPYFALVLGKVQGILKERAKAEYEGRALEIDYNETFESLGLKFSTGTVDPITPANWTVWTHFIQALEAQSILLSGATLPLVRIERRVAVNATLEAMAGFFGVDAASVGQANQTLPGILLAGKTIAIAGHDPYTTTGAETLLEMTTAIKPPVTMEALSNAIANTANLVKPLELLYFAQTLPDVTFSTTKLSLGPVGSTAGPDPALSFLFSLKHPRQFKNLFLNLKYVVNEAEYGIATVSGTGGYQSSSWLTFILPFGSGLGSDFGVDTRLPQVQIPVPLRSYPTPPSLLGQSGLPSQFVKPPATPDEAVAQGKQWNYRFDFSQGNAAQDSNHVEVTFNASAQQVLAADAATSPRTLRIFRALAQFTEVYAQLIQDLAILPTLPPGQYNRTAAIAVGVLDRLAQGVAQAMLPTSSLAVTGVDWPELRYQYRLQTQSAEGQLRDLVVTQEAGPSGAGPLWPDIFVQSLTGGASTGPDEGFIELARTETGGAAQYAYPPGFEVDRQITQRFLFEGRDVIQNQNAWGGIFLTRNDDLVASGPLGWTAGGGPTGPLTPIATNNAFLYETPLVRFIDPMTPLLVDNTAINVAGLTGNAGANRLLAVQIENMLNAVLEWGAGSPIQANSFLSILCSYGYPVAGEGSDFEVFATVPVRLVPVQELSGASKTRFAVAFSESVRQWPGWATRRANGVLIFDLNTFTIPLGATGSSPALKPILQFENLRIPISTISDP